MGITHHGDDVRHGGNVLAELEHFNPGEYAVECQDVGVHAQHVTKMQWGKAWGTY